MKIFVAGGTGYIGRHVIERLVQDGHSIRALVRKGSEAKLGAGHREPVIGDISDPLSLDGALDGCEAVVYLIGLRRELPSRGATFELAHVQGVRRIYERASRAGVRRWIHISANGVKSDTPDGYIRTKYRAEEFIKAQDLDYTILRPSIVFGNEAGDTVDFVTTIKGLLTQFPLVVPVMGNGRYKLQPVHIDDLAHAISMIVDRPSTFNRTYSLCGAQSMAYNDILDIVTARYGLKKKAKLHIPAVLMRFAARLFQKIESFPVTAEQVGMLVAGNTCGDSDLFDELGIVPRAFREAI
ncbi:MAG: NAD(P)H-binding protein [Deltaproteobacteria bacterium]|nr:NAD(P)H-binding protein [Deltaproteobacteria bacterium]MCL5277789.1 NAD(P)H-binding protein [Deltaproteobacteria bacterium]